MQRKLSPMQQIFVNLVERGTVFTNRGQSLVHRGMIFPVAMAKSLNIKPQVKNYNDFMYEWNKY